MDFEHSVFPEGLQGTYEFSQDQNNLYVKINCGRKRPDQFSVHYNKNTQDIQITDDEDNVFVSGIVNNGHSKDIRTEFSESSIECTIGKEVQRNTQFLIKEEGFKKIDGKSSFILAMYYDALQNYEKSWDYMMKSSNIGFFPGRLFVADALADSNNKYAPTDLLESEKIYLSICNGETREKISLRLVDLYRKMGNLEKLEQFLVEVSSEIPKFKVILADFYSPQGQMPKPEKAFVILKEIHDSGNKDVCLNLAWYYENGIGTEKDLQVAIQLKREFADQEPLINCSIQKDHEKPVLSTNETQVHVDTYDMGIQREGSTTTDMGIQREESTTIDMGIQREGSTTTDMGIQREESATIDMGIQREESTTTDMGIQREGSTTSDMEVQNNESNVILENIETQINHTIDSGIQSEAGVFCTDFNCMGTEPDIKLSDHGDVCTQIDNETSELGVQNTSCMNEASVQNIGGDFFESPQTENIVETKSDLRKLYYTVGGLTIGVVLSMVFSRIWRKKTTH